MLFQIHDVAKLLPHSIFSITLEPLGSSKVGVADHRETRLGVSLKRYGHSPAARCDDGVLHCISNMSIYLRIRTCQN